MSSTIQGLRSYEKKALEAGLPIYRADGSRRGKNEIPANLKGRVFGTLKAIKYVGPQSWLCECLHCGKTKTVNSSHLTTGKITSCATKPLDLTGQRFTRLTAIKRAPTKPGCNKTSWVCKCDCGKETVVDTSHLNRGKIRSCGCLLQDTSRTRNGEFWVGQARAHIRGGARLRGLPFDLTWEQVKEKITRPCAYCGCPPQPKLHYLRSSENGKPVRLESIHHYHGLDRIDSSLGYTDENCVPCCSNCNLAKSSLTVQEFVAWVIEAAHHLQELGFVRNPALLNKESPRRRKMTRRSKAPMEPNDGFKRPITARERLERNTRCLVCNEHGEYVLINAIRPLSGDSRLDHLPYFVCAEHAKPDE